MSHSQTILHHLPARGHNALDDDLVEFHTWEETVSRNLRWRRGERRVVVFARQYS